MSDLKRYYSRYPITNPAYLVARIAGNNIKHQASLHFSGRLIDIGCGDKSKKYLVGEYVNEYVGLDHEGSIHDRSCVDMTGTAYEIPQLDRSFDCVLCTAVLEHLEDPAKALSEAFRVLKPGGFAIYTAPFIWHLHEEPRDFYRYSKYGLEYLFVQAGFEIVEIKPMAGFWITIGSEFNYYLSSVRSSPMKYLIQGMVAINNLIFQILDNVDGKMKGKTDKWTWMYLVVARKSE